MKKKAVCWGIGSTGRHVYGMVKDVYDVLCFVDNDTSKYRGGRGQNYLYGRLKF
ncbi:MAG: hypothetical protein IJG65_04330 [Synergistaceae bacterium]|nr:hypothetical protein [Synergistaceae bacterium]